MSNREKIDGLIGYIEDVERSLERLERKYQGVRPGWVSTDLAIYSANLTRLRKELAELRGE